MANAQTINDFNPTIGAVGDAVTLDTTSFPSSGTVVLKFNGVTDSTAVLGPNIGQVTGHVPSGATAGLITLKIGTSATVNSYSSFTVIGHGPYITSFTPTIGAAGDLITINGVHLTNTTSVTFNGTPSSEFVSSSDGQQLMSVRVPTGATTGPISVTTTYGSFTTSSNFAAIGPGPYISGLSPQTGAGRSQFYIQGVHFTGVTSVKVNGANVTFFYVLADTQIVVTNQASVTTGFVSLNGSGGAYTSTMYFYVPPVISSFTPAIGLAGTNVTITGQNFLGVTNVQFGGINATFTPPTSNTALQTVVPAGAPSGVIRVDTPSGAPALSSTAFRIAPTITSFSPASGPAGTSVTIFGANLNEGLSSVKFNGTAAGVVGSPTFGQVTVTVPAGATTGPVSLTTTNGTVASIPNFYLPAGIGAFSPTNSAPGTTITITGTNLLGTSAVSFSGAAAAFIPPTTNTILQATVPGGVTTGPISVTTPAGTMNSGTLLFYALPVVSNFSPTGGIPGTVVTINGTNFTGTTAVQFGGADASFSVANNGKITATVPTNAVNGPINVTAPAGTGTSSSQFLLNFASDLSVMGSAFPNPVFVGSNLTYTVVISNSGPAIAQNVVFTNTLPGSVSLVSATSTMGTLNTNNSPIITGVLGSLGVASSATFTLVVAPQSVGDIMDAAGVTSPYTDPFPSNNSTNLNVTVYPLPVLSIQIYTSTQIQVSWPAALSGFGLQYNTLPGTNGTWMNLTTPPFTIGTQSVVIDPITADPKFYRLKN